MNSRRFTVQRLLAHSSVRQETAALRDFEPAYDRFECIARRRSAGPILPTARTSLRSERPLNLVGERQHLGAHLRFFFNGALTVRKKRSR